MTPAVGARSGKPRGRERRWPQYLSATLATLSAMSVGLVGGWTSNALPLLKEPITDPGSNSTLPGLSEDQGSWVGSLTAVGALLGSLPAGYLANAIGRRGSLLVLAAPMLLGWGLILVALRAAPSVGEVWLLYVARFVLGMAVGAASVVTPLYNEEIAHVDIRGELGVYQNLMIDVGILAIYIVGAYASLFWQTLSPCVAPLLLCVTFVWMPESPVYLLAKGRVQDARAAEKWLYGEEKTAADEKLVDASPREDSFVTRRLSSAAIKALVIVVGLMAFRQLLGINAFIYYTVEIFEKAGSTLEPSAATIVVGVVLVVATLASSLLVDRVGRRALLLASGLGSAVSHAALTVYFVLGADASLGWLPLTAVAVFITMYSVGFGSLPWFIMAEVLPARARGWMSGLSVATNWGLLFVVTKGFGLMTLHLGPAGTFGVFCVNSLLASLFVVFLVPETSGKTREEIQKELRQPYKPWLATRSGLEQQPGGASAE